MSLGLHCPVWLKIILYPFIFLFGIAALGIAIFAIVLTLLYPNLPSLEVITDYRPKIPLRIYTADAYLLGEFGEERRAMVAIKDVPLLMKQAILAAEDDRFYEHGGIDYLGVLRAAGSNILAGGRRQGASTITQQVARNFFLSSEKTFTRKLYEALLSFKIEDNLSKDQILELYFNQIFLGHRAYGFSAAAKVYFDKNLNNLSIAEMAMLAGLPKAPSTFNPISNPQRAKIRQQYVLGRMHHLGWISNEEYQKALAEPLILRTNRVNYEVQGGEYIAEMARQIVEQSYPEAIYTRGLKIYTTIVKDEQDAAYRALRKGVFDYDKRHGYRGAESQMNPDDLSKVKFVGTENLDSHQAATNENDIYKELGIDILDSALAEIPTADNLIPAIVLSATQNNIRAYTKGGDVILLQGNEMKMAQRYISSAVKSENRKIQRGAVIRLLRSFENENSQTKQNSKNIPKISWKLAQLPQVESAFVVVDPQNGAIKALIGGFDYNINKFNHVTQAQRQPGSTFKPFIFSAAIEKGYTPGSFINDSPVSFGNWTPHNYDHKFLGPISLRRALEKSKNIPAVRLMNSVGVKNTIDHITKFGFDAKDHPAFLPTALGAGSVSPWQMVMAYSVFANGGFKIEPYIVQEVVNNTNVILSKRKPQLAGDEDLRAIDVRNAYVMDSMLRSVATYGTAARTNATLKRSDLAGKTGTSNDYKDAWFCGYQLTRVACAWVGFDQPRSLGRETGGLAAMPIWIEFMKEALKNTPEQFQEFPEGLIKLADGRDANFKYAENVNKALALEAEMSESEVEYETKKVAAKNDAFGALLPNKSNENNAQQTPAARPIIEHNSPPKKVEPPKPVNNTPFVLQPNN